LAPHGPETKARFLAEVEAEITVMSPEAKAKTMASRQRPRSEAPAKAYAEAYNTRLRPKFWI